MGGWPCPSSWICSHDGRTRSALKPLDNLLKMVRYAARLCTIHKVGSERQSVIRQVTAAREWTGQGGCVWAHCYPGIDGVAELRDNDAIQRPRNGVDLWREQARMRTSCAAAVARRMWRQAAWSAHRPKDDSHSSTCIQNTTMSCVVHRLVRSHTKCSQSRY